MNVEPRTVLAVVFATLLLASGAFAVDVSGSQRPDPVAFDDTIKIGMTGNATVSARAEKIEIPRAQVFYSEYRYVVGYYGVSSMVDELDRAASTDQFGMPLVVYVTDFAGEGTELTEEGYIVTTEESIGRGDWIDAEEAVYVVGSRARTPSGSAVVPFGNEHAASAFADEYGGRVVGWDELRRMRFGTGERTLSRMRADVADRRAWANESVERARQTLDRPVSVVVGEDAATVGEAIEMAPAGTTVRIPPGTYRGVNVTVNKPITLRGAGNETHLVGDGEGSVVKGYAPRIGVVDVRITGVGNETTVSKIPENRTGDWDYRVKMGYGYGDAGVELDAANHSYVHGVAIDTPANGVVLRSTEGAVVDDITVDGSEEWADGFMGVMVMDSRPVVQNSTVSGGRDGVYTHLGHALVVRDNRFEGMRFGTHLMYTSNALIEGNVARDTNIGVVVMTRPTGNALVGNDVRDSKAGVSVAGSESYVADNVLVNNGYGMDVISRSSYYVGNVLTENDIGARASSIIPTNRVYHNDFVDNDRYVVAVIGPLRVWTGDEGGNYWAGAPGHDRDGDGVVDRTFQPTGPVDSRIDRVDGTPTLARSPAVAALRSLQDVVPGLRRTGVVDNRPLSRPVHPTAVNATQR
jgi:nitrous oxidase accessory protein NosD/nitrous oxide reductase accessory protein NosL